MVGDAAWQVVFVGVPVLVVALVAVAFAVSGIANGVANPTLHAMRQSLAMLAAATATLRHVRNEAAVTA